MRARRRKAPVLRDGVRGRASPSRSTATASLVDGGAARAIPAGVRRVQHAHQKGIIHRDIKPSNVLVAVHDGKPVPRSSISAWRRPSRAADGEDASSRNRAALGTPAYMSPEQAGMRALDVDTTTDIYSLGVVLYELLIGALPFDPAVLRGAGDGRSSHYSRRGASATERATQHSAGQRTLVAKQRHMALPTLAPRAERATSTGSRSRPWIRTERADMRPHRARGRRRPPLEHGASECAAAGDAIPRHEVRSQAQDGGDRGGARGDPVDRRGDCSSNSKRGKTDG